MSVDVEVPCILAPIAEDQLLIPNVAVAEVLRGQRARPAEDLPAWCMGHIMWRGVVLPLLIFEQANDSAASPPPPAAGDSVLVMNRTRDLPDLGFYALLCRGAPRLLRVAEEDLDPVADAPLRSAELARVRLGEDEAVVPRLAFLEELVIQYKLGGR